jgi:hypothetical protein
MLVRLLGRAPQPFTEAFVMTPPEALRAEAVLRWADPLLRGSLAIVWFAAAFVSAFVYPKAESLAMLAAAGSPEGFAPVLLWGAIGLDTLFGVLTIVRPSRLLWLAQLTLVACYSAIIGLFLPEMWAHPFGPLVKNVPILAILVVLLAVTRRRV